MNENQTEPTGQTPNQFGVNHAMMIHVKNREGLSGLPDTDPAMINAKKDFFSGFLAALSYLRVTYRQQIESGVELSESLMRDVSEAKAISPEKVSEWLNEITTKHIESLDGWGGRLSELNEDCMIELTKLVQAERPEAPNGKLNQNTPDEH